MKSFFFFLAIVCSAAVAAVGAGQTAEHGPQHQMSGMPAMMNCPTKVAGAEIAVEDTQDGIAVTVTTKSGDVAELRRRLEHMGKMHSDTSETGHGGMIAFSAKYEEVPNGARLTLTPKDPAKLEPFRATVRRHAEAMKKGECSMMQAMMQGMMEKDSSRK